MKITLNINDEITAFYEMQEAGEITDSQKELCYNKLAEVLNTKMTTDADNHKVTADKEVAIAGSANETERHIAITKSRSEVDLRESEAEVEIRKMNYEADTKKREMMSANHTLFLEKMGEVHELILDKTEANNHTAMQVMHSEVHAKFLDAMNTDE